MNARTVKLIRAVCGVTQREFAQKIGCSRELINKIELNERTVTERTAGLIRKAYEVTTENLRELEQITARFNENGGDR